MSGSDSSFTKVGLFGLTFTSFFMCFRFDRDTPSSDDLYRVDFVGERWMEMASVVLWKFKLILGAYFLRVRWLLAHSVLIVSQYFLSPNIYVPYFEANMLRTHGYRPQISYILQYFSAAIFHNKSVNILSVQEFMDRFSYSFSILFHFRVLCKVFQAQSGNILWDQWP
jgi:hypothetical protein